MSAETASRGILAEGLGRRFDDLVAVDGLDLEVPPGAVIGLLGPNGAGKTTTMRMLATLLRPTAGRAWVAGRDVVAEPLGVRRQLGYLTGDTGLYDRLTPRELLTYFGRLHGRSRPWRRRRIAELEELLGLGGVLDRRCGVLSSGQRQRVSIARAVLHDPAVLVLDEPTRGLDIVAARGILDFFRDEARRGKAVVLSTHVLAEVELVCDRAAVIHRGRIRAEGHLDELLARTGQQSMTRAFLELIGEADAAAEVV